MSGARGAARKGPAGAPRRPGLAGLAGLAAIWGGLSCVGDGPTGEPVPFVASLVDPGPVQSSQEAIRSHGPVEPAQTADSDLFYLQMVAPIEVEASLNLDLADGSTLPLPGPATVFLEGEDPATTRSAAAESDGGWGQILQPGIYDVYVAPDTLLGQRPAYLIEDVGLWEDGQWEWAIPEPAAVTGVVLDDAGQAVAGMILTVYRTTAPALPMGVTARSAGDGTFDFNVPPGRYDIVASPPPDGSIPAPPVRIVGQQLPLLPGFDLLVEVPRVRLSHLRGQLVLPSGAGVQGRVRVGGWVAASFPGAPIPGSRWRAEIESDPLGHFELTVPFGTYELRARPRAEARYLQEAIARVEADESEEGAFVLPYRDAPAVSIRVVDDEGEAVPDASLRIEPQFGGRFAFAAPLSEGGTWLDRLAPGPYLVGVVPAVDDTTGSATRPRWTGLWEVPDTGGTLEIALPAPARFDAFVYTEGRVGVADVRVLVTDPETGVVWDDVVTRLDDEKGNFSAVVPRR